jgi:hypothetical protein
MNFQWLECNLPPHKLSQIKVLIANIGHKWTKEVIKKAENPFAQVLFYCQPLDLKLLVERTLPQIHFRRILTAVFARKAQCDYLLVLTSSDQQVFLKVLCVLLQNNHNGAESGLRNAISANAYRSDISAKNSHFH